MCPEVVGDVVVVFKRDGHSEKLPWFICMDGCVDRGKGVSANQSVS